MLTICFASHTDDGPEVQIIRREHVNAFADWQTEQTENNAIGRLEANDPACAEVLIPSA